MSIAEQFIRAKNDYDEVYAKGIEVGKAQGGNTEEAYNQGVVDGRQAQYDKFWDSCQNKGEPSCYKFAFAYNIFNDAIYNPKYPIITSGTESINSQDIFAYSPITDTKVTIDVKRSTGMARAFNQAKQLVTIHKLIVTEKVAFTNTFDGCESLKNIVIEGIIGNNFNIGASPLLTLESITSIINALSQSTTNKTLTLSKTAVQNAFETTDLDNSTEWTTLKNSRSNWTITLS